MMTASFQIEGIDVQVEGEGSSTVLLLHGWPDTRALWDDTVAALRDGYRCVRFNLPGYDLAKPPGGLSVDAMVVLMAAVVSRVSPGAPVTLLIHDWGSIFGQEFAARHPERVERVVIVDVGDASSGAYLKSLKAKAKLMILGYQLWLALAWQLGKMGATGVADRMTRFMAKAIGCRNPPGHIGWQMNYPYGMQWLGTYGGFKGLSRVRANAPPRVPTLFVYGQRKPFMFHSSQWLQTLEATPGCAVHEIPAGHWLMRQKPERFNPVVRAWLDETPPQRS
ncbi:alpha/beta fold hydrolase [Hydrogenophaga sp.]|uniref:alpha/beta fold hydrolase n=1 Tax=Hydrogenophaga sp. TaxID=1904254 RepID=UPI003561923B